MNFILPQYPDFVEGFTLLSIISFAAAKPLAAAELGGVVTATVPRSALEFDGDGVTTGTACSARARRPGVDCVLDDILIFLLSVLAITPTLCNKKLLKSVVSDALQKCRHKSGKNAHNVKQ
jgi:hypothetical protein